VVVAAHNHGNNFMEKVSLDYTHHKHAREDADGVRR